MTKTVVTKKDNEQKGGASFNYTSYFLKKRNRKLKSLNSDVHQFIETLEYAVALAVKMTGGEIGKLLNLRRLSRNKQCCICESMIFADAKRSINYFHAKKIDPSKSVSGFSLEWTRDELNGAQQLGEDEWLSGPLMFCPGCQRKLLWCEKQVQLKQIAHNIDKNEFANLPKICNLYYSLGKTLHLSEFFVKQFQDFSSDPVKNEVQLSEMRKCIINCCEEINLIGQQINELNSDIPEYPSVRRHEWLLQQNVYHYSNRAALDLRFMLSASGAAAAKAQATNKTDEAKPRNNTVLMGLMRAFCTPIQHVPIWSH